MSERTTPSLREQRLASVGRRVAELIRQTLPLGVECHLLLEVPHIQSEWRATLEIDEPRGDHNIRNHKKAIAAVSEFAQVAAEHGIDVKHQLLGGCNNLSTRPVDDLFAITLGYLRQHGVSDLTLAPLERLMQDALATPEGLPASVPPRTR